MKKFFRMTANFDMSSYSELEVKEFCYLDNALVEAAYQVNEFMNCISGEGVDREETDWDWEGMLFKFYGVSASGEDFVTVKVEEVSFEDWEEYVNG